MLPYKVAETGANILPCCTPKGHRHTLLLVHVYVLLHIVCYLVKRFSPTVLLLVGLFWCKRFGLRPRLFYLAILVSALCLRPRVFLEEVRPLHLAILSRLRCLTWTSTRSVMIRVLMPYILGNCSVCALEMLLSVFINRCFIDGWVLAKCCQA